MKVLNIQDVQEIDQRVFNNMHLSSEQLRSINTRLTKGWIILNISYTTDTLQPLFSNTTSTIITLGLPRKSQGKLK